jgi:hypothetical protein
VAATVAAPAEEAQAAQPPVAGPASSTVAATVAAPAEEAQAAQPPVAGPASSTVAGRPEEAQAARRLPAAARRRT